MKYTKLHNRWFDAATKDAKEFVVDNKQVKSMHLVATETNESYLHIVCEDGTKYNTPVVSEQITEYRRSLQSVVTIEKLKGLTVTHSTYWKR